MLQKTILKYFSRRFFVFCIGTIALFTGQVSGEIWLGLAGIYMGLNTWEKVKAK